MFKLSHFICTTILSSTTLSKFKVCISNFSRYSFRNFTENPVEKINLTRPTQPANQPCDGSPSPCPSARQDDKPSEANRNKCSNETTAQPATARNTCLHSHTTPNTNLPDTQLSSHLASSHTASHTHCQTIAHVWIAASSKMKIKGSSAKPLVLLAIGAVVLFHKLGLSKLSAPPTALFTTDAFFFFDNDFYGGKCC
jgi:hypothetical protein